MNLDKPKIVRERNRRLLRATEKLTSTLKDEHDRQMDTWQQICWRSSTVALKASRIL